MCQQHWTALREAVIAAGLGDLIAPDGQTAVMQVKDALEREKTTPANYDPLMTAFFAIGNNAMGIMERAGANPLYLMMGGPEDPVTGYGPENDGLTWPRCSLCYLNLAHKLSCTDPECKLDKERGYDYFIERAVADQVETWEKLKETAG